nr:unnamed protein product [Callosobruchus analis]
MALDTCICKEHTCPNTSVFLQIASLAVLALVDVCSGGGHGGGHKKVIIHVPFKVKHIHHTHTVIKHVPHHEHHGDKEYYKVIGYSGGIDDGEVVSHGHGGHEGGGGGHHGFGGGHDLGGGQDLGGGHGGWVASGGYGGGDIGGGHDFSGGVGGGIEHNAISQEGGHEYGGGGGYGGGDIGGGGGGDIGHHGYD